MNTKTSWRVTAIVALPLAALAQADPAAPSAAAPPLPYRSAFSEYKPWRDLQRGDWRAMNDALGSASTGGHGAHGAASGTATPAPAPAKPASRQQAPAAGHKAHHTQGGQQ